MPAEPAVVRILIILIILPTMPSIIMNRRTVVRIVSASPAIRVFILFMGTVDGSRPLTFVM
jgi:hypothetical protein